MTETLGAIVPRSPQPLPSLPQPSAPVLATDSPSVQLLRDLPPPWIQALHQAARQCNDVQIQTLLQDLPPAYADIADAISQLAAVFEFDEILGLTTALVADYTSSAPTY